MANHALRSACINSPFKHRGFTLVEVLVTLAIVLMLMLAVTSALYFGGRSTAETRVMIAQEQELMKLFHQLRRQATNIYIPEDGECLLGEEGTEENKCEVYFLTTSLENYQGVGEVGYKIMRDHDGYYYLAYTEFPYARTDVRFAQMNPQDKWRPATYLVKRFKVEYRSQNLWLKEWRNKNEAPDQIRFTLWYKQSSEDDDNDMKKLSFIVVPAVKAIFN